MDARLEPPGLHSKDDGSQRFALARPKSRLMYWLIAALIAIVAITGLVIWRHGKTISVAAPPHVPVTVTDAAQRDVPIYYDALGTVQAYNTVAIRAQVTGQLVSINFQQGQEVHKGDVLAKIDPAPFKANVDQAVAKKHADDAQLIDAQLDLTRFTTLVKKNFETQQNVDLQQAKVDQLKSTIDADVGAIESAQTQLDYATIVAPIDGVVGFRQLDLGNIIHPTDTNPLTVLTQIKPSQVIFTLPQSNLGPVREAMLHGSVSALAYDQDGKQKLADGHLLLIDNQIDQATSTIRLKAEFPNEDERLWPGEFVRIRILITTQKDAVTLPSVAVQRGPESMYVWVVKQDNTVEQRPITALIVSEDLAIATKGLAAGEHIVVTGQSRLDVGTHVDIRNQSAPPKAADPQADKS
jgi:membrane fusion protein, multidrug efflux system